MFAIIFFLVFFGYDVLFEVRSRGRTPGKRWTGLRVVRTGGQPVTFVPSCVRNVMRLVDILPVPPLYAVGMLSIFVTGKNQRLGDLAAGTLVVRERPGSFKAATGERRAPRAPPTAGTSAPSRPRTSAPCASSSTAARASPTAPRAELAEELERRLRPRVAGAPEDLRAEEFLERLSAAKSLSLRPAQGSERVGAVRTAALGLMATLGLAACGEDSPSPEAASRPDAAHRALAA